MKTHTLTTPLTRTMREALSAGDRVLLNGTIYAARDAAHMRFQEALSRGERLPFDVNDATIYYVGPTPTRPGHVIGSAGPTTASRMDRFMPALLDLGLAATIGKGLRSPEVLSAMAAHKAVFLGAVGGAGALLAASIVAQEVIAYDDLGAESCRRLTVKSMPLIVLVDAHGHNLYVDGPARWRDGVRGSSL